MVVLFILEAQVLMVHNASLYYICISVLFSYDIVLDSL